MENKSFFLRIFYKLKVWLFGEEKKVSEEKEHKLVETVDTKASQGGKVNKGSNMPEV